MEQAIYIHVRNQGSRRFRRLDVSKRCPTNSSTAECNRQLFDVGMYDPLGKVGQPNDVAVAALYLAPDVSAMVTGHTLRIDGGWTAA